MLFHDGNGLTYGIRGVDQQKQLHASGRAKSVAGVNISLDPVY